ncbi:MAG TPA: GAF domain-containing SpoIIE family protein phosphatase [Terriglobia bacterium]|nr:GAF domain-containing SpoIIE family protein phosphatase [Terriglobia bacterium]
MDLIKEIGELGIDFCLPKEPGEVVEALVKRLTNRYALAAAGIWRWNDGENDLTLVTSAGGIAFPETWHRVPAAHSLLGTAAQTRSPQVWQGAGEDGGEWTPWAKENRLHFLGAYPLADGCKTSGVLVLASTRTVDDSEQAVFRLHACLASLALHDADCFACVRHNVDRLQSIVEASKVFNSTLDLAELLGKILDVAKTLTKAERGTLFLVDEKADEIWSLIAHGMEKEEIRLPRGRGIAGHVAATGEIVNIPDAYADPRFDPEVDKRTGFRTHNILTLPIRNKAGKIVAALQLLNKAEGHFTGDDTDAVMTLSGQMALSLENAQLHRDLLEKERLEREMALARGIQRSLLPETTPVIPGFDLAVLNEPCFEVGGDYYDFLSLGPNTLLVVIADVEGKGISSAMVMSNLQATLRALVLHLHSLNDIAESVNKMILKDTRGEKYMTMFMGLIDTRRKAIHYINCGHVPPVIVRPGSEPIQLTEGGMVIGLFENVQFERGHVKFQPGDILLLCTDGITESMDAKDEEFGLERLVESASQVPDRKAKEIVLKVCDDVTAYSRGGTHMDDKVMLAIKIAGDGTGTGEWQ